MLNCDKVEMVDHRPELYTEVKLFENSRERERFDNNAEVYSIVKTIQTLEKAYSKDFIKPAQYTPACSRLLSQFKVAFRLVQHEFKDFDTFATRYRLGDCQAAIDRITEDRPITIKDDHGNQQKLIVDITSLFLTLDDNIQLEITNVDQLMPNLKSLVISLNRLSMLPENYEGKKRVTEWLNKLKLMSISESLTPEDARQFSFDLQAAFDEFRDFIENK